MPTISNERFMSLTPLEQRVVRDRQAGRRDFARRRTVTRRLTPNYTATLIGGDNYGVGGVHTIADEFRLAMVRKQRDLVYRNKKPTNAKRWCAIEIEMLTEGSNDKVADKLCEAGVARFCHLKDDGSLHGTNARPNEHELVLCAELTDMPDIIDKVCKVLRDPEVNAGVNKTCGLHIHLDMRNDNVEEAYRNLVHSYEPLLSKLVPTTRLENTYCKAPTTSDFEDAQCDDDRYKAINPCAYSAHETLEIRLFAGSVNADKIKQYLAIVASIAYAGKQVERRLMTADQWAQAVSWAPPLTAWVKQRAQDFGNAL